MNLSFQNNLRLVARNEGKIKSYESCSDVRAWSHDLRVQDRYLREWMKADMPICIIPTSTLTSFLKTMTCKSRRRATPRCHPDCKSKVVLESICNSCQAMKECLQKDEDLEKYFVEEELESSHWPCDRCLEALKNIKMIWKILIDKLFSINLSKCNAFKYNYESMDNVRSIANLWQAEILQQATFIKNVAPALTRASNIFTNNRSTPLDLSESRDSLKLSRAENNDNRNILSNSKSDTTKSPDSRLKQKASRNTFVRFKMNDVGCDPCFIEIENEKIEAYKKNIKTLEGKCCNQHEEIENLRKENNALKMELDKMFKRCHWKASFFIPDDKDFDHCTATLIPKPFEPNEEECSPVKNIDSEMIITMKNGKNESFKHVSLLQVLHKTNDPFKQDSNEHRTCNKKEDPLVILNKVQNTFGAIVRREMSIVNDRRHRPMKSEVDAMFYNVNSSKSVPSCSASSSRLSSEHDIDRGDRT